MSVTVISSVDPLATAMEQSSLASDSGVASAGAASRKSAISWFSNPPPPPRASFGEH